MFGSNNKWPTINNYDEQTIQGTQILKKSLRILTINLLQLQGTMTKQYNPNPYLFASELLAEKAINTSIYIYIYI